MIRAFVNKEDNSVAFLERPGKPIHPSFFQNEDIYFVEVDPSCLEGVDEQHFEDLFYDPDTNVLFRDERLVTFKTQAGKEWLVDQLQAYSLIPPDARPASFGTLLMHAKQHLPRGKVEETLADGVLTDEETQEILDFIRAADDQTA